MSDGVLAEIKQISCSISAYNYYDYVDCCWKLGIKKSLGELEIMQRDLNGPGLETTIGESALPGGCKIVDSKTEN
jgi:hypothetical protein